MRKPSRRGRRGRPPVSPIVILLLVAFIVTAWWLVHPRERTAPRRVAQTTPQPLPTTTLAPPSPSPTTSPTPLPAASPSPLPSLAPVPARSPNGGAPRVALIVDDCGQWIDTERGFVALNIPLTMSVLPDVAYTGTIAKEASAAGKGVMLHLPMETISGLNPGPGKVTTEMTDDQIEAQVESDLAQVPLAAGVNNHEGSKGSADRRVMQDVISVIAKHGGLFFIDSKTSPDSVASAVAQANGVPTADRDVFLDNRADVAYTEGQLREAMAIARRTGSAIAIGHPRPTTLEAVKAMIPEFEADGIEFVLAGDLVVPAKS
ncbi:MAG: divergent polysaccharide deacetylase family protein [Candidatus Eremiobacteraeota bacterium]|nr:divergent polysaccharide deacetylase family protein [Candidatus Eremiobacteraeota bacterium]